MSTGSVVVDDYESPARILYAPRNREVCSSITLEAESAIPELTDIVTVFMAKTAFN